MNKTNKMIKCPFCERLVRFYKKGEKIICPDCGQEIKEEAKLTNQRRRAQCG